MKKRNNSCLEREYRKKVQEEDCGNLSVFLMEALEVTFSKYVTYFKFFQILIL